MERTNTGLITKIVCSGECSEINYTRETAEMKPIISWGFLGKIIKNTNAEINPRVTNSFFYVFPQTFILQGKQCSY